MSDESTLYVFMGQTTPIFKVSLHFDIYIFHGCDGTSICRQKKTDIRAPAWVLKPAFVVSPVTVCVKLIQKYFWK